MLVRIVVFSLLTVVIARNVQYTDEDAHRDMLSIVNYAFGYRNNGRLRERTDPGQLRTTGSSEDNSKRAKTFQPLHNEPTMRGTDPLKYSYLPVKVNYNQGLAEPMKTPLKSNYATGIEAFPDVNQTESVNSNKAMGYDRSQERSNLSNLEEANDKQTKVHNVSNNTYIDEPNPTTDPINKLYTTPASRPSTSTIINEAKSSNMAFKRDKIKRLNRRKRDSKTNIVTKRIIPNWTQNNRKNVVPVNNKANTVKKQSREFDLKKPAINRWISSFGPIVDRRTVFVGNECPTELVKFGNTCLKQE